MKHVSLATRYRPQLFSEVAGQDLIKTVLSRAAAEDRVAPGYLFSGTRGVGKTTLARIFARALNCEHAPCAEPCNSCAQCRRVTDGTHPDVIEIDGASNNKVDDARALRETVGFAPMEGRYKIFIIDEAHMLTPQAFNALLKTLEEPPPHVVFIFATTEIHKFLPTILSRCQVFSFRHLTEETIATHLGKILGLEGIPYEDSALHLIARRAAGSARDSMSLLDQVLSYGNERVSNDTVRTVLGLAGMDALGTLFDALARHDCAGAAMFTRELVTREVDIGFFLRELVDHFRSLFLLRQCGREAVARLGVPNVELDFLAGFASRFTPSYLHAAWQMLINSHRSVTTSPEPASALDLLLVNLALLPQLLPASLVPDAPAAPAAPAAPLPPPAAPAAVPQPGPQSLHQASPRYGSQAGSPEARKAGPAAQPQPAPVQETQPVRRDTAAAAPQTRQPGPQARPAAPETAHAAAPEARHGARSATRAQVLAPAAQEPEPPVQPGSPVQPGPGTQQPGSQPFPQAAPAEQTTGHSGHPVRETLTAPEPAPASAPAPQPASAPSESAAESAEAASPAQSASVSAAAAMPAPQPSPSSVSAAPSAAWNEDVAGDADDGEDEEDENSEYESMGRDIGPLLPNWEAFTEYVHTDKQGPPPYMVKGLRCVAMDGDVLDLECDTESLLSSVQRSQAALEGSLSRFLRHRVQVRVALSELGRSRNETLNTPVVLDRQELRHCFELLNAHVDHVQQL